MKFVVFSSGSDGNCTLIQSEKMNILVDIGLTRKCIVSNLEESGLTLKDINAILITHEHVDHIKGLDVLIKELDCKFFMSKGTYYAISKKWRNMERLAKSYDELKRKFEMGLVVLFDKEDNSAFYKEINLEDINILPLPMFHDAAETVGFRIVSSEKMIVLITDTGYVHEALYDKIENADVYILESNHDPEILMASDRPYELKMRIISDHGHMSNVKSMLTLVDLMGNKTKHVLHAHISQECNLSQIIEFEREKIFKEYDIDASNITFEILAPRRGKEYEI